MQSRLVGGVRSLLLPRIPSPPAASKWTKIWPALSIVVFGMWLRCWGPLWKHAFGAMKCAASKDKGKDAGGDTVALVTSDDLGGDFDFAALTGTRYQKSIALIESDYARVGMTILAICLEAVRRITEFFIGCSSDTRALDKPPPLLNLILPSTSILTKALQHMSHLYFDDFSDDSRCWLLTAWLGFESRQQHFDGAVCSGRRVSAHLSKTEFPRAR